MLCKSIDWFLYEGNTGTQWFNNIDISVSKNIDENKSKRLNQFG